MVMGRNSSKRRSKDEPDIMRWVLNLVVPLMSRDLTFFASLAPKLGDT